MIGCCCPIDNALTRLAPAGTSRICSPLQQTHLARFTIAGVDRVSARSHARDRIRKQVLYPLRPARGRFASGALDLDDACDGVGVRFGAGAAPVDRTPKG